MLQSKVLHTCVSWHEKALINVRYCVSSLMWSLWERNEVMCHYYEKKLWLRGLIMVYKWQILRSFRHLYTNMWPIIALKQSI